MSGPSSRIEVAPLALEGTAVACYDLGLLPTDPDYFTDDNDDMMFFDRAPGADEIATLAALATCD